MSWQIPLGVEVMVKKAAIDPEFRAVLVARRAEAAAEIDLKLQPAEAAMLAAVPAAQLEAIIDRTTVPQEHRRAFLGEAAAAMLAALGAMSPAMAVELRGAGAGEGGGGLSVGGAVADFRESPPTPSTEIKVREIVAKSLGRDAAQVRLETPLAAEPAMTDQQFETIRKALEERFDVAPSLATLKTLKTVGEVVNQVDAMLEVQKAVVASLASRLRLPAERITPEKSLADDLKASRLQLAAVREDLSKQFRLYVAPDPFFEQETVGGLIDLVAGAVRRRQEAVPRPPGPTRGIRPDLPQRPRPVTDGIRPDMPPPVTGIRP